MVQSYRNEIIYSYSISLSINSIDLLIEYAYE